MAALAVLLKNRGCAVSGCDLSRSARTDWLESLGVPVALGHDPAHVEGVDEVVATPAVARDNPELLASAGRVRMRGEVLAEVVNAASDSIAVCGSHGKTTTATFVAKLLLALGEDVEWAIGGETGSPLFWKEKTDGRFRSSVASYLNFERNALVLSCFGSPKIREGGPSSQMTPSSM